jgi:hypothetical protein
MNKTLQNQYVDLELKDGILFLTYKKKITLEIAKEVVKLRKLFSEGGIYPMLISGTNVAFFEKEARDFLSSAEGVEGVSAGAIIGNSVFHIYLGNFFIKVSKPSIPAKLFTDREKALKWLEGFK